jgi:flagellin
MPTFINTNLNSMNVQMALNASQSQQTTAMQRLATGLRINSAADNAAGYAIATRMSAQIAGDTQAAANANDAISLTQTAGGDLTQITNNLQTMRNLAVQASNATNSASDRAALNNQLQALSSEIDRVAQNSSFNGVNLLDGSFTAQNFQIGANAGASNQIQIASIASARTTQLGAAGGSNYSATVTGATTVSALAAGSLTLNGVAVGASVVGVAGGENAASALSIANAINATTGASGVTASASATTASGLSATTFTAIAANSFSINGIAVGAVAAGGAAVGQGANVAAAINLVSAQSGVTASANATTGAVTLTAVDGRNINVTANTNNIGGVITSLTTASLVAATGFNATLSDTVVGASAAPFTAGSAATLTINGVTVTGVTGTNALSSAQNFVAAFNSAATAATFGLGISGITASVDSNAVITLTSNGSVASMALTASTTTGLSQTAATYTSQHGSVTLSSNNVNGLVISGGVANSTAGVDGLTRTTTAATTSTSGMTTLASVNISTAAGASAALATIDGALAMVTATQAALGAVQNRFTSVVTSLQTTSANLTAAQSRIQSTDYAAETANLSRTQILQQAGNAMLAQANQQPNQVMTLLR